jgi:hypothetical protein
MSECLRSPSRARPLGQQLPHRTCMHACGRLEELSFSTQTRARIPFLRVEGSLMEEKESSLAFIASGTVGV